MAKKLSIYRSLTRNVGVVAGAVLTSILEMHLSCKESETIDLDELASDMGEEPEAIVRALQELQFNGLIKQSGSHVQWKDISQLAVCGVTVTTSVVQGRLPESSGGTAPEGKKRGRKKKEDTPPERDPRRCGEEHWDEGGESYKVLVGQGGEGDDRFFLTIKRLPDQILVANEPFETPESAWCYADEYRAGLKPKTPTVLEWMETLNTEYDPFADDDKEWYDLAPRTFETVIDALNAVAAGDGETWGNKPDIMEKGEFLYNGLSVYRRDGGAEWPGIEQPVEPVFERQNRYETPGGIWNVSVWNDNAGLENVGQAWFSRMSPDDPPHIGLRGGPFQNEDLAWSEVESFIKEQMGETASQTPESDSDLQASIIEWAEALEPDVVTDAAKTIYLDADSHAALAVALSKDGRLSHDEMNPDPDVAFQDRAGQILYHDRWYECGGDAFNGARFPGLPDPKPSTNGKPKRKAKRAAKDQVEAKI